MTTSEEADVLADAAALYAKAKQLDENSPVRIYLTAVLDIGSGDDDDPDDDDPDMDPPGGRRANLTLVTA